MINQGKINLLSTNGVDTERAKPFEKLFEKIKKV
jgi:hypothetical protein